MDRKKLVQALRQVRDAYMDAIAKQIVEEPHTPLHEIARQQGVSMAFVIDVAKQRGILRRSNAADTTEVIDGEQ